MQTRRTNSLWRKASPSIGCSPHLTPYGIIMEINREPVAEFTEDIIQKDHEFWSQYSERLVGNWITYDTKIKEICDFLQKGVSPPRFQRIQRRCKIHPR